MDTAREATIFGQKLSLEQAKQLAEKLDWFFHEEEGLYPNDGDLVEFKTNVPVEYGNCTVLEGHRLADGVCFFELTDMDTPHWIVGAAIRCKASRWHEGDVGTFTASDLPDKEAIERFVASLGIEPDLRIHELRECP